METILMQEKQSPEKLIKKYLEGTCDEREKELIESWHLHDLSQSKIEPSEQEIEHVYVKGRRALIAHMELEQPVRKLWPRIAAAASILFLLGIAVFFLQNKNVNSTSPVNYLSDVAPGGNRAILTLGNGRQINLTGAKNGQLAKSGTISINKTADGNITYQSGAEQASIDKVEYNTMSTPVGGQYHLILGDGTGVWLNAASSISYPTAFTGAERKVEVTGEVYFEVAHNAAKPFRVIANQQVVEVLGTHFNINAYTSEVSTKTTLLEGSVKVFAGNTSVTIKPGQQSVIRDGHLSVNPVVDLDEAVAWKNGYFKFKDENIASVMRKLSRWYNIELQYKGKASAEGFNGTISRSKNISQVLSMLERTKAVHFKIDGRRVEVIQ
jgi:transmembrane sensor